MSLKPLLVDSEIEKITRRNNSATRRRCAQAQQVAHHSSTSCNIPTGYYGFK